MSSMSVGRFVQGTVAVMACHARALPQVVHGAMAVSSWTHPNGPKALARCIPMVATRGLGRPLFTSLEAVHVDFVVSVVNIENGMRTTEAGCYSTTNLNASFFIRQFAPM